MASIWILVSPTCLLLCFIHIAFLQVCTGISIQDSDSTSGTAMTGTGHHSPCVLAALRRHSVFCHLHRANKRGLSALKDAQKPRMARRSFHGAAENEDGSSTQRTQAPGIHSAISHLDLHLTLDMITAHRMDLTRWPWGLVTPQLALSSSLKLLQPLRPMTIIWEPLA